MAIVLMGRDGPFPGGNIEPGERASKSAPEPEGRQAWPSERTAGPYPRAPAGGLGAGRMRRRADLEAYPSGSAARSGNRFLSFSRNSARVRPYTRHAGASANQTPRLSE